MRGFRYILLDQIEFRAARIGQSGATWETLGLNSWFPVFFLLQNFVFPVSFLTEGEDRIIELMKLVLLKN